VVLNDCHVNLSPAAQNTCGLDATNAHDEAYTPILKLTEELPCLRPPGIGQQNPATWSERAVQYGSNRAIEGGVIEDIGAQDHIKGGPLDPVAPICAKPSNTRECVLPLIERRNIECIFHLVCLPYARTEAARHETWQSGAGTEFEHALSLNETWLLRKPLRQTH